MWVWNGILLKLLIQIMTERVHGWRGSFQVSIPEIIKEVSRELCTYSYICTSSNCLESCVHAEETLHICPVPKLSHNATKYTVHRTRRGNSIIWGASSMETEVNEGYTWKYIDRKWNIESTQEVITFNQLEGKWEKQITLTPPPFLVAYIYFV